MRAALALPPDRPLVGRLALWTLVAGALAALLPRLALAFFAFPSADDYCIAFSTLQEGFWGKQINSYLTWTGRYSAILLETIVVQFDLIGVYRWFAMATLVSNFVAIRALMRAVCGREVSGLHVTAVGSAATAVFAGGLPSTVEAFYWMPGQASYQWGVILYFVWLALLIRLARREDLPGGRTWGRVGIILLTILLPGFNEVMAPILVATIAPFILVHRRQGFESERFLGLLLAVIVLLTAVSFLAPGNANRSSVYPVLSSRHNLEFAILETGRQTVRFIVSFGAYPALWVAAFAAWWWGASLSPTGRGPVIRSRHALAALASLVVVVYLTLFPVYWEYGADNYTGEGRTYNVTYVALCAIVVVVVWYLMSTLFERYRLRASPVSRGRIDLLLAGALSVLLIVSPSTIGVFEGLRTAPRYLRAERNRTAVLRGAPREGVVVVNAISVQPRGLFWGDIQPDESHWINICVADYFGLESVRTPK